ncbi:hypothetical protein JVT61DRAFT_7362 [Boletus reticuloceps]|uniref:DUSP domain-containing protein n=1 Tax=Boletus reticuloceps TaxID=495285 RepID=A0A8I3A627_9AGAM|nr:hypothetical protein JVT61DRAFT_7362 [Boletus reticuloceps]
MVGDTWYIVSRRWYRRWENVRHGVADKAGPVDNMPLVDRTGNLILNLTIDVEFVPSDVWKVFITWCVSPFFSYPPSSLTLSLAQSSQEAILENLV